MHHYKRETLWSGPLDGLEVEIKTNVRRVTLGKGYCEAHQVQRMPVYVRAMNGRFVFEGYAKEDDAPRPAADQPA